MDGWMDEWMLLCGFYCSAFGPLPADISTWPVANLTLPHDSAVFLFCLYSLYSPKAKWEMSTVYWFLVLGPSRQDRRCVCVSVEQSTCQFSFICLSLQPNSVHPLQRWAQHQTINGQTSTCRRNCVYWLLKIWTVKQHLSCFGSFPCLLCFMILLKVWWHRKNKPDQMCRLLNLGPLKAAWRSKYGR